MINFVNLTDGKISLELMSECNSNDVYICNKFNIFDYIYIPEINGSEYVNDILMKIGNTEYIKDPEPIYQLYKFSLRNKKVENKKEVKRDGFQCFSLNDDFIFIRYAEFRSNRYRKFVKDKIKISENGTIYKIGSFFNIMIFAIFAPGSFILKMEKYLKYYRDDDGSYYDLEDYRKNNVYHPLEILDYIKVRSLQDKMNEKMEKNAIYEEQEQEQEWWKI